MEEVVNKYDKLELNPYDFRGLIKSMGCTLDYFSEWDSVKVERAVTLLAESLEGDKEILDKTSWIVESGVLPSQYETLRTIARGNKFLADILQGLEMILVSRLSGGMLKGDINFNAAQFIMRVMHKIDVPSEGKKGINININSTPLEQVKSLQNKLNAITAERPEVSEAELL